MRWFPLPPTGRSISSHKNRQIQNRRHVAPKKPLFRVVEAYRTTDPLVKDKILVTLSLTSSINVRQGKRRLHMNIATPTMTRDLRSLDQTLNEPLFSTVCLLLPRDRIS